MRHFLFMTFCAAALFAGDTAVVPVAWKNIGPGGGGWVQSILASRHEERTVFVGGDVGGVYKSLDGGGTYATYNDGLEDYYVECMAEHPKNPSIVYAGCQYGVYKSDNGGKSWNILRNGFPKKQGYSYSAPISTLTIDEINPETIYAGIGRPRPRKDGAGSVYRSTDGGANWSRVNDETSIPKDAYVTALQIDSRDSQHLYLCCQYGFFQSTDGGVSWKKTVDGLPHQSVRRMAVCRSKPDVIYISMFAKPGETPWSGGIFRSDDGGMTWRKASGGLIDSVGKGSWKLTAQYDCIAVHPENPDIAYTGGIAWVSDGVYKTVDGGKTWNRSLMRTNANPAYGWIDFWGPTIECMSMSLKNPDILYAGTPGNIYTTKDGGATWHEAYSRLLPDGRMATRGYEILCVRKTYVHPQDPKKIFVSCMDVNLLLSADAGATFRRVHPGKGMGTIFELVFDPDDARHIWGAFGEQDNTDAGAIAESRDEGLTWTKIGTPETGIPASRTANLVLARNNDGTRRLVTTVEKKGVYASDDDGRSWRICEGIPSVQGSLVLAAAPGKPAHLRCVLRKENTMYRSDDAGRTWRETGNLKTLGEMRALAVSPADPETMFAATREARRGDVSFMGGIHVSRDGGATWEELIKNRFADVIVIDAMNPNIVYAGYTDHPYHDGNIGSGVHMSMDGGKSWKPLNSPSLYNRNISCITVDPHDRKRLYVGTGGNTLFVGRVE
ncbi:MAG: hypothetical protein HZC28_19615 [Spirochaetes bacterium]|nr:hypothetical protein [Spirochaetota bacterium]